MAEALPLRAIFFDARDTLGNVVGPGHLVAFRPTTEQLLQSVKALGLKIGVITNLPDDVSAEAGKKMVTDAVLSQDPKSGKFRTIGDYIPASHVLTNHEAGVAKPDPRIYRKAAALLGVKPSEALFCGENLPECLGAAAAGLQYQLKPFPPGHEFLPALITKLGGSKTDSGRAFEALFEMEHMLGERIFGIGKKVSEALRTQDPKKPIDPNVRAAMGIFVYLIDNFADPTHLKAEEAVIPIAVARGMDPRETQWVLNHHEQARAYWRSIDVAWHRILTGDADDRVYAIGDFWRSTEAFVILFEHHAERENNEFYPTVGKYFTDNDDTILMNIIGQTGWRDIGPFAAMVESAEQSLGTRAEAAAAAPKLTIKKAGGAAGSQPAGTNGGPKSRRSPRPRASR
jgi:hemerythrin-like domain-containing protein